MAKDKEYQLTSTELAQRVTTPLRGAAGLSIIGPDGKPWTLAELSAWWGAEIEVVEPEPHAQAAYMVRAHELRVADGPATQIVRVIDQHGNPIDRAAVCRWWTDAPHLPALPAGCYASYLRPQAVVGETNAGGDVGFGMGKGDMPGSSGVWVANCQAPSGGVFGLGWKPFTNHAAVVVTFQVLPVGGGPVVPPPEPVDTDLEEIRRRAETAVQVLTLAEGLGGETRDAIQVARARLDAAEQRLVNALTGVKSALELAQEIQILAEPGEG
jgi:hypothetical protein